jgi:hypothetical protein
MVFAVDCCSLFTDLDRFSIEVGANNWPMPIPLTKANEQWYFNTAAGKEEIINRHIGKDVLHAVGLCRAYVKAQLQFAGMNPDLRVQSLSRFDE